jgi:protein SCO1/2
VLRRIASAAFAITFAALALPAFAAIQLQDQNGRAFSYDELRGKPAIVTFIATHCKDACPLINAQFGALAQQVKARHLDVHLVSITLDPEHDSLKDMQRIASLFKADPQIWTLISGKPASVHQLMSRFNVIAVRGKDGFADTHSTFVFLVDRNGRPRKALLASNVLTEDVIDQVHRNWHELTR